MNLLRNFKYWIRRRWYIFRGEAFRMSFEKDWFIPNDLLTTGDYLLLALGKGWFKIHKTIKHTEQDVEVMEYVDTVIGKKKTNGIPKHLKGVRGIYGKVKK